jgi:hypothetical protein
MIRLPNRLNGGNGIAVGVEEFPMRIRVADCREPKTATVLLPSARATLEVAP